MAQIEQGINTTSAANFFASIGTFLAANGWTLDLNTDIRLHVHKGSAHFELYHSTLYSQLVVVGCTGYDAGEPFTNQPGTGNLLASQNWMTYANTSYPLHYLFVSCATSFHLFSRSAYSAYGYTLSMGIIDNKIGTWTDGNYCTLFGLGFMASGYTLFNVRISGVWSPIVITGGVNCLLDINIGLRSKQPFSYSAGILPQPIMVFKRDLTTNTKFHPIGFLPDIFAFAGGDVYSQLDEIIIGTDTYTAVHYLAGYVPLAAPDLLVKLG